MYEGDIGEFSVEFSRTFVLNWYGVRVTGGGEKWCEEP
jgi:hypothetical protein